MSNSTSPVEKPRHKRKLSKMANIYSQNRTLHRQHRSRFSRRRPIHGPTLLQAIPHQGVKLTQLLLSQSHQLNSQQQQQQQALTTVRENGGSMEPAAMTTNEFGRLSMSNSPQQQQQQQPQSKPPATGSLNNNNAPLPNPNQQQPSSFTRKIRSIIQLSTAHAHKVYFSGQLVKHVERQTDGRRSWQGRAMAQSLGPARRNHPQSLGYGGDRGGKQKGCRGASKLSQRHRRSQSTLHLSNHSHLSKSTSSYTFSVR